MVGYLSLQAWYPIITPMVTLIIGALSFFSIIGVGRIINDSLSLRLPKEWLFLSSIILGILSLSFIYQVQVFFKYNSYLSICIFILFLCLGNFKCFLLFKNLNSINIKVFFNNKFFFAIIVISLLFNILLAISPSTKIDELAYVMPFISRILEDKSLLYYDLPWESSIISQMIYQFASLPYYLMGFVNTSNFISFLIFVSFIFTFGLIIHSFTNDTFFSLLFITSSITGLYVSSNLTTSAPNSLMVLSTAACILLIILKKLKKIEINQKDYFLLCGIFVTAMFISKISLLPIILLITLYLLVDTYHSKSLINFFYFITIPIIFILTSLIWTWTISGSPFGNIGIDLFVNNISSTDENLKQILFDESSYNPISSDPLRNSFFGNLGYRNMLEEAWQAIFMWSPLILISLFYCFFNLPKKNYANVILFSFLFLQILIIYLLLPYKIRHLSGIQYLSLIVLIIFYKNFNIIKNIKKNLFILLFIFPWCVLQVVYISPLITVSLGIQNKTSYYQKYIAFYDDYVALNQLLPRDTELLAVGTRVNAFYSPRKIIYNTRNFDFDSGKHLYLFLFQEGVDDSYEYNLSDKKLKVLEKYKIYENNNAVLQTFRSPIGKNKIGKLEVYQISNLIYK